MKPKNNLPHDHSQEKGMRHWPKKVKQYLKNLYTSKKCNCMSRGSYNIVQAMSWARGENWRRTHPKSLNKSHKKS
ncbi:MAG TPA: hypothetical protein VKU36_00130 [Candidatus Babeliales bacterium]|jgi:hypothetical protein|nr:hypothetical protein [Candidatus Babeliales bacterium]